MLRSLHHPLLRFAISPFHRCNPSRIPSSRAIASLSKSPTIAPPTAMFLASSSRSRSHGVSGAFRMCSGGSETNPDGNIAADATIGPSPSVRNPNIRFCQACGSPTKQVIPDGEEKERSVCSGCGRIHYENPKMDAPCWLCGGWGVCCRRSNQGNLRRSLCRSRNTFTFCSVRHSSDRPIQSYIIFRARLKTPDFSPGPESLECALFAIDDIPFHSQAFSSVIVTLKMYIEDIKAGKVKFHYCTINKRH